MYRHVLYTGPPQDDTMEAEISWGGLEQELRPAVEVVFRDEALGGPL